jgi:hypothetical protein
MFTVNGQQRLVIGVIPDYLRFELRPVWALRSTVISRRRVAEPQHGSVRSVETWARRSMPRAAEMTVLMATMARENAKDDSYITTALEPLRERYVGRRVPSLVALSLRDRSRAAWSPARTSPRYKWRALFGERARLRFARTRRQSRADHPPIAHGERVARCRRRRRGHRRRGRAERAMSRNRSPRPLRPG